VATALGKNAGRHVGGLLRERDFRLFWFGETVSEVGTRMANVAVPLLAVTALRAGTFMVGLLTALQSMPWLLISLPAGALLERARRRRVMIACDVAAALLFASVPVAAWTGTLTIGQLLVVVLLTGTVAVFFQTAYQAHLPDLLAADELPEGNAKLQASANVALLGGPGLGGYAAQALGAASSLLANVVSFGISAACLASIRRPEPTSRRPVGARASSFREDIREGTRFVFRDPYLQPLTNWAAAVNFGLTGYDALVVLFLVRVAHVRADVIGLLIASSGAGAIVGSLLARRIGARFGTARSALLAAFALVPFILLIPLTSGGPRLAFFVVGSLVSNGGIAMSNVYVATFRQSYPPPEIRARVTATAWFLLNGTYPAGALLGGALGTWLGIRGAMWIMLGAMVAGDAFLLTRPLWQDRDLPRRYAAARQHRAARGSPTFRGPS
jgi:predicted MFS family arabinose efflux permease